MKIKYVATCLTDAQTYECEKLGIEVMRDYVYSYGQISHGCVTDFSVHCFNSHALEALKNMGVGRATLHPELNLAQIRDIKKCIDTEAILYGKIPLMKMKIAPKSTSITDRKGVEFLIHGDDIYNCIPIYMADKMGDVEKSGITHGRLIFTTESPEEVRTIIKSYMYRKMIKVDFTRGKFYSKV
ncbi:MAG: hypothetical protein FWF78_01175 [Defluviitaleaceae bacterium]|nr:hypothetical protein [Defluviitaleaceae bacterium]